MGKFHATILGLAFFAAILTADAPECFGQQTQTSQATFGPGVTANCTFRSYESQVVQWIPRTVIIDYAWDPVTYTYYPVYGTVYDPVYGIVLVAQVTVAGTEVTTSFYYDPDGPGGILGTWIPMYLHHTATAIYTGPTPAYWTATWSTGP